LGQRLKKLGLSTFWNILAHIPHSYTLYAKDTLIPDHPVCLDIVCQKQLGRSPWRYLCHTFQGNEIELVFFHPPKPPLPLRSKWRVKGILTLSKNQLQIIHPHELKPFNPAEPIRLIVPHYTLSKGLSSNQLSKWVKTILDQWPPHLEGPPPYDVSWPPWKEAFSRAHFPSCKEDTFPQALWRQRLAFDELIAHHLSHLFAQEDYTSHPAKALSIHDSGTDLFLNKFGYPLTSSQNTAWQAIKQDLSYSTPMMRLLHGDVGSGKTIVAFLAMIQAAYAGKQACLMDLFSSLGLVVIDEQQRFGVMQRLALINKGCSPHLLFLSATPIPRTFERLLWGQIEVSHIEKRPSHIPLKSYVVSSARIPELKEWIGKCFQRQERVYWVCPAIEDETKGVLYRSSYWENHFPGQVTLLHGQMSSYEKEQTIEEFRSGHKPFLVTTTVIEVGVHVAEASTMIIEESPRFGLSQLHQLRGRVGRDHIPGHCFFLYTPPVSHSTGAKLEFMRECHNGFEIAEKDWSMRGSGVLLGTQQSGLSIYHFFDVNHHSSFLEQALAHAKRLKRSSNLFTQLLLDLFQYESPEILKAG